MCVDLKLNSRDLALTAVFASLYAVLSALPLFPVIGVVGKSFTMALIIAPLVGLIIGPYRGALAASIGGFIGWSIAPQYGLLYQFSFIPGASTALCSGLLYKAKWKLFAILYPTLLLTFGFFPSVGPLWLYPDYLWFHLLGLTALAFQVILTISKTVNTRNFMLELGFVVGMISFIATLFGHVVGGLFFEVVYFPTFISSVDAWRSIWQGVAFVYPIERSIVVLISILIGAPLIRALKTHGFEVGGK